MNIKNINLIQDYKTLYAEVLNKSSIFVYERQLFIFRVLGLLEDTKFLQRINELRKYYEIPSFLYDKDALTASGLSDDAYIDASIEYVSRMGEFEIIASQHDILLPKGVFDLCNEFSLLPSDFAMFLQDYMTFGLTDLTPIKELSKRSSLIPTSFKHKLELQTSNNIYLDTKLTNNDVGVDPDNEVASNYLVLKIYKNTSLDGITKFIRNNKSSIREIQRGLDDYPKYELFQEDTCKVAVLSYIYKQIYTYEHGRNNNATVYNAFFEDNEATSISYDVIELGENGFDKRVKKIRRIIKKTPKTTL